MKCLHSYSDECHNTLFEAPGCNTINCLVLWNIYNPQLLLFDFDVILANTALPTNGQFHRGYRQHEKTCNHGFKIWVLRNYFNGV